MNCIECGKKMKKAQSKPYHFSESGLSYVYLLGCPRHICTNSECEEEEVTIPGFKDLLELLALSIARGESRLLPEEIRYLRSYLGFSGADFAGHIKVAPETVSRWERGTLNMKPTVEKFLRVLVLSRSGPFRDYDDLAKFAVVEDPTREDRCFGFNRRKWREKKAA